MVKVRWYKTWWFRISLLLVIICIIIFGATKTVTYYNLSEYLKTEIEELKKQLEKSDSLYLETKKQKDKVKVIREKIQVKDDLDKIKKLEKELQDLKKKPLTKVDTLSPEDLNEYFKELLKKK